MSVKHVKQEFKQICDDYHDMIEVLKELQDEVAQHVVSDEKIEETKSTVEKMKANYMRWSRIMYLLDLPNKDKKAKKYKKCNPIPDSEEFKENRKCIDNFKDSVKHLKELN